MSNGELDVGLEKQPNPQEPELREKPLGQGTQPAARTFAPRMHGRRAGVHAPEAVGRVRGGALRRTRAEPQEL